MRIQLKAIRLGLILTLAGTACTTTKMVPAADSHTDHAPPASSAGAVSASNDPRLPADAAGAAARLAASPRHGEYVTIRTGGGDSVRAWVVYPQRSDKAPVVIVVHEIFGLSSWVRGVADQLAADGFIAVAPDLLTMKARQRFGTTGDRGDQNSRCCLGSKAVGCRRPIRNVSARGAAKIWNRRLLLGRWCLVRARGSCAGTWSVSGLLRRLSEDDGAGVGSRARARIVRRE
jgi:hypothetical protein